MKKALKSLLEQEQSSNRAKIEEKEKNLSFIDEIRRGFADIERRISNMDREHMKYVRATVTRMNYLMNSDRDMKGLMIDLLNQISGKRTKGCHAGCSGKEGAAGASSGAVAPLPASESRRGKKTFLEELKPDEALQELNREEVLRLNPCGIIQIRKAGDRIVYRGSDAGWRAGSEERFCAGRGGF